MENAVKRKSRKERLEKGRRREKRIRDTGK